MLLPFTVDLTGHIALVTGGSGVLCSEMARALFACGARVAVLGRSLDKARKVTDPLGENALALAADVTDIAALEAARQAILEKWGKVSILINGAGGNHPSATTESETFQPGGRDFFSLKKEGLSRVFDTNYLGTLLPIQVFGKDMVGVPGASIVNISSMAAYQPMTKVVAYAGAKAAVNNLTQWLATYFAPSGLRVNAIAPGFFATEQNRALFFNEDGTPTPRVGKILAATPMGRLGEAGELIGALLFLVSPAAASFVTGVVIPVDGGFMAYSGV